MSIFAFTTMIQPIASTRSRIATSSWARSNLVHVVGRRNASSQRRIPVQLKADIPGLGEYGSIKKVHPGRMRNDLFPKGLANYVLKGVEPTPLDPVPGKHAGREPSIETDFAKLRTQLKSLPPLVLHRLPATGSTAAPTSQMDATPIFGSVSATDIADALKDVHGIHLVAPHATIRMMDSESSDASGKIKALGTYLVHVVLKQGGEVPLTVVIEAPNDAGVETS
ncbi:hypothetical protein FRC03_007382 [Tulasnella sp. 419]|nr:hypothetical protein FRC03_007382 [Tulasnella sp. 419]